MLMTYKQYADLKRKEFSHLPRSREEAQTIGSISYFTGVKCSSGHIDKRQTYDQRCYACDRERRRELRKLNPDKIKEKNLRYKQNLSYYQQEKKRITNANWRKNNKDKTRIHSRSNQIKNREKRLIFAKNYYKEKMKSPIAKLNFSVRTRISISLKNNFKRRKDRRHWEILVNFTLEELKIHLENKFINGMTWENYGSYWHVDHVKPISLCDSFEETWALSNLQPLKGFDNLSKGNRYIG